MHNKWLTAALVEDIQCAVHQNISVRHIVEGLQRATLPGIMEYGCLRWSEGYHRIPPLPNKVATSEIGQALSAVRSELGLRKAGPQGPRHRNIDCHSVEFMAVRDSHELDGDDWMLYQARFCRSTERVGFGRMQSEKLQGAMHEMMENALIHAFAPVPVLVGYRVLKGISQFVIADVGRGVLASLRTCSEYQDIELHKDAIRKALQDGTSRFGSRHGGLGFRDVFKALTAQWGRLRFRSGEGCITMDGIACAADTGTESFSPSLPGFQLTVTCQLDNAKPPEPLI